MKGKGPFRIGDMVRRKSYDEDLLFMIIDIGYGYRGEKNVTLKGLNFRILADAPISDLVLADDKDIMDYKRSIMKESNDHIRNVKKRILVEEQTRKRKNRRQQNLSILYDGYELPGKILHIDSDPEYLKDCLMYYRELKVPSVGEYVKIEEQPETIIQLLETYNPDILVLTGHDSLRKNSDRMSINSYKTSKFFVNAVKKARRYESDKDGLVIVAGACQSFYEAILEAGANFASSPDRVLIQCYDPVLVAEKISHTPIDEIVRVDEVINNTITKKAGFGGMETRGKLRLVMPNMYNQTLIQNNVKSSNKKKIYIDKI